MYHNYFAKKLQLKLEHIKFITEQVINSLNDLSVHHLNEDRIEPVFMRLQSDDCNASLDDLIRQTINRLSYDIRYDIVQERNHQHMSRVDRDENISVIDFKIKTKTLKRCDGSIRF